MPEINNNNNIVNINDVKKTSYKPDKTQELLIEDVVPSEVESTDLKNDPKCLIGRSLVHHSSKSKEAKELKKRVESYTKEFLQDKEKATFLMDSVDTFKDAGFSLEESTELTLALTSKLGEDTVESYKEIPESGSYVAGICRDFIQEFGWDKEKSLDATVKAMNIISGKES